MRRPKKLNVYDPLKVYYWCYQCRDEQHRYGKYISDNSCGHECFGNAAYLRDLITEAHYWCPSCTDFDGAYRHGRMITNGYCGHGYFGAAAQLRDMSPDKSYWCSVCTSQVYSDCGHGHFGCATDLITPGLCYWCKECGDKNQYGDSVGQQIFKNCKHNTYGNPAYLRDLTPGKQYKCGWCDAIVSKNCGHCSYGMSGQLIHTTPDDQNYWCRQCQDMIRRNSCNCYHTCFGNPSCQRDLTPGNMFWCGVCKKQVTENCAHYDWYGNKACLVNLSPNIPYYCKDCKKIVTENCGHQAYGHDSYRIIYVRTTVGNNNYSEPFDVAGLVEDLDNARSNVAELEHVVDEAHRLIAKLETQLRYKDKADLKAVFAALELDIPEKQ